jgi:hypothetical protein
VRTILGKTRGRRAVNLVMLTLAAGLGVEGFLIEPVALEITRHQVTGPIEAPIRIAHLTDLHTRGTGRLERAVLAALDAEKPDLIAVTGDTVDHGSLEAARNFFLQLHAPLGVWVVRGNWEHWQPPPRESAFYSSVGAGLLLNEGRLVRRDLFVAGFDDSRSGFADPTRALKAAPPAAYKLALFHSPEAFDEVQGRIDLALAGHTHGGQVRVPWVGALWLPPGSGRYVEGLYSAGKSRMYVARGLGTSLLPIRLFCRPELAFVSLLPDREQAAAGPPDRGTADQEAAGPPDRGAAGQEPRKSAP